MLPMLQPSIVRGRKANGEWETAIAGEQNFQTTKSFKEAKRNVNERSKRNFAKILKRGSLCIVFRIR